MEAIKKVLVVEDETHIAIGIEFNLRAQGYEVKIAETGNQGLKLWQSWKPDLIVLDIMLPGIDGLSVLQNIRLQDERLPILILSAKGTTEDRIQGLKYGVDDYLAKPFDLDEFLLRVERLLTRDNWLREANETAKNLEANLEPEQDLYQFGDNQINFDTGNAYCAGKPIQLTEQELKLLKLFINNSGKTLTRTTLLEVAWGYTKDMSTRTVDNFIVRFRKYFEKDPKSPIFFKSKRSVGYQFNPEEDETKKDQD